MMRSLADWEQRCRVSWETSQRRRQRQHERLLPSGRELLVALAWVVMLVACGYALVIAAAGVWPA